MEGEQGYNKQFLYSKRHDAPEPSGEGLIKLLELIQEIQENIHAEPGTSMVKIPYLVSFNVRARVVCNFKVYIQML